MWGNCKGCRFFSSQQPNPGDVVVARCQQPELRRFDLSVSGASGCNAFEAREAAQPWQVPATPTH